MYFVFMRALVIVLLIAATQNLPYDYYTLLRFIVTGVSAYGIYFAYQHKKQIWLWVFIIIAVLFNPISPIYLDKAIWVFIDYIVAAVFFVSLWMPEKLSVRRILIGVGLLSIALLLSIWTLALDEFNTEVRPRYHGHLFESRLNEFHGRFIPWFIIAAGFTSTYTLITYFAGRDKANKGDDVSLQKESIGDKQKISWAGGIYKGYLKEDVPSGSGVWHHASGKMQYIGKWENGLYHGIGILKSIDGNKYAGEFSKGNRHGYGSLIYPSGYEYIGEWKNDKPSGHGVISYPDGKLYIGEFMHGVKHGEGILTIPDGKKLKGRWENGKYVG